MRLAIEPLRHFSGGAINEPMHPATPEPTTATISLNDYFDREWHPKRKRRVQARDMTHSSLVDEVSKWNNHVRPTLGKVPLNILTERMAEQWKDELLASGLARNTVKHCVRIVKQAAKQAGKDRVYSGPSPLTDVRVEKGRSSEDVFNFADEGEWQRLIDTGNVTPEQRQAIGFAMFTGLRLGEQKALHWQDVHLDGGHPRITVRYGSVPSKAVPHFGPPKGGVVRDVTLIPFAVEILREIIATNHGGVQPNSGLVFANGKGGHFNACYSFGWERKTTRHGKVVPSVPEQAIGRHIKWHDLRHTFCSHLIMGTWGVQWSVNEVCSQARHSDISITMKYAHLSNTHLRDKAAAMHTGLATGPDRGSLPGDVNSSIPVDAPVLGPAAQRRQAIAALRQARQAIDMALEAMLGH